MWSESTMRCMKRISEAAGCGRIWWRREERRKVKERVREEGKKEKREKERKGKETASAKRRCVGFISADVFGIFGQGEDLERCGGVSWCDLLEHPGDWSVCEPETRTDVSAVLVVTDVLVSFFSAVTECYEDVSLGSDWEFVEPQSFSFSKKRFVCVGRESRRDELRRDASKSASKNQKKDDARPRHSKVNIHRRMKGSVKRRWRYKEVFGVLEKERRLRGWNITWTKVTS